MKKYQNRFKSDRFYRCTYALVLDHRHPRKNSKKFPVTMRFTIDRQSYVCNVEGEFTEAEFDKICNLSNRSNRSDLFEHKMRFEAVFDRFKRMIEKLGPDVTIEMIRTAHTKIDKCEDKSFVGVWKDFIYQLQTEDNGKRWTTGESYQCSLNSFIAVLGEKNVKGFKIDMTLLNKWNKGMENGVTRNGVVIQRKLADATRGIYLRNCRAIWNKCTNMGFMLDVPYPFSNKKELGKIVIPKGDNRKHEYLPVDKMTELYKVFMEKRYPPTWSDEYIQRAHISLGLFLVQYLCNGFNLADAGLLRYNNFYFTRDRQAFLFNRKKTKDRSQGGSEVIIPIIEPLQKILDEIASEPKKNAYVFPFILQGYEDEINIRKRVKQENANIKDRVERVCREILGWEISPSGTWARHSFATNLTHAGVDMHYISESMGHSESGNVTNIYIDKYPIEKQKEYNSLLLNLKEDTDSISQADIDNMGVEELKALVKQMMSKGR